MTARPASDAPPTLLPAPHPVVLLPPHAVVVDLSAPPDRLILPDHPWQIGRYDELRGIYTTPLFTDGPAPRDLHVGLDLGGPAGVAVHAWAAGEVEHAGFNPAAGDYGHVLVCAHPVGDRVLYVLLGHLSAESLRRSPVGRRFAAGEVLGWLGEPHENGGWPPHLHVQLCWERPETHDLPGAVALADRAAALRRYPDPRLILGPIY